MREMRLFGKLVGGLAIIAVLFVVTADKTSAATTSQPTKAQCPSGETLAPQTEGNTVYLLCSGGTRAFVPSPSGGITFTATCASGTPEIGNSHQGNLRGVTVTCLGGSSPPTISASGVGTDTQAANNPGGQSNSNSAGQSQSDCVKLSVPLPGGTDCIPKDGPGGPIMAYLKLLIRFLAGIIGVLAVLAITISSIQYIMAAGNPQAIASAKSRLSNAVIGVILFILMFGILEVLIPGGVFTSQTPPASGGTP
jgi:hypothetical protein